MPISPPPTPATLSATSRRIVIDLDDTLTHDASSDRYADKHPRADVVARLRAYQAMGYAIVIFSARNMRSYDGRIGLINLHTLPTVLDWLKQHDVPHDEVIMGKPWCGPGGFYVDDKAIRPDEFVRLSEQEILALIGAGDPGDAPG